MSDYEETPINMTVAAERIGVSASTLSRLISAGDGPRHFEVGRQKLIYPSDLERWMESRSSDATDDAS